MWCVGLAAAETTEQAMFRLMSKCQLMEHPVDLCVCMHTAAVPVSVDDQDWQYLPKEFERRSWTVGGFT